MRISLVIPGNHDRKRAQRFRRILRSPPPIGVAYVAGALRAAGHQVQVIDQFSLGLSVAETVGAIVEHRSEAVGFSTLTPNAPMVAMLSRALRAALPTARLFAGNAFPSEYPSLLLQDGTVDVVVHGEGEESAIDLVAAWADGSPLSAVPGLSWWGEGQLRRSAARRPIDDLDALPRPAWDLMPTYFNEVQWLIPGNVPVLAVQQNRGCPWKCSYCAQNFLRPDVRRRDPAAVAAEARWLYDRFGVRHFGFIDSIFPLTKADGIGFAEGLIREGLAGKVKFSLTTRTDLVDEDAFRALADVGLHLAYLGIESASEETLAAVRKNARVQEARRSVRLLQGLGVNVYGLYMLALPGETLDDMRRTIDLAVELDTDVASFSRTTPYAGSPMDRAEGLVLDPKYRESYDNWHMTSDAQIPGSAYTVKQISKIQRYAMFRFYFRPRRILRALTRREFSLRTAVVGAAPLLVGGLWEWARGAWGSRRGKGHQVLVDTDAVDAGAPSV